MRSVRFAHPASMAPPRPLLYRPGLAWFSALGSAWVFVLVALGAFTTSIGAGMAFEDWPLSNGSVNPEGWLTDVMMFAEHSHRLSGATMGLITLVLAFWLTAVEPRRWVRRLAWGAVAIVIIQGLIGGFRVLLDATPMPGFEMSLGQLLRIPHGVLAQVFVCVLFAVAASLSRPWLEATRASDGTTPTRRLALATFGLFLVQLTVAAAMRHNHAGLAIPTFPLTPEGHVLPSHWDYRVALAFAHRALALLLALAVGGLAWRLQRDAEVSAGLRQLGWTLAAFVVLQISLGASVIWTGRHPYYTTAHVLLGAFVLATCFLLCWLLHRARLVSPAPVSR